VYSSRWSATFVCVENDALMSVYQTWYDVAPSTGFQRTRPGRAGIGTGVSSQRMLKPKARLQLVGPPAVTPRTRAYSEYGLPVNQGSVSPSETAGTLIGGMLPSALFVLVTSPPV
jgi:hypothetical protein